MGLVHTAIANALSALGQLDNTALPDIIDGEESILKSYDAAAAETKNRETIHKVISDQRKALRAEVDHLRA